MDALVELLTEWEGAPVAVRIVSGAADLVAVFGGVLGPCSQAREPALLWPVEQADAKPGWLEQPGIYVHPDLVGDVRVHEGSFVVEFTQGAVKVNLRRL